MFEHLSSTPIAESIFRANFWKTPSPARTALLLGGGAAAALGIGYALFKPKEAAAKQGRAAVNTACTQWNYLDLNTQAGVQQLGTPGRFRVEIMFPPGGWSIDSLDDFNKGLNDLQAQLPGIKIEGAWLGMLGYPNNTSMPADWQANLDAYKSGLQLRIQYVSAYPNLGDVMARFFGEQISGSHAPLAVVGAWKCASSSAIEPQPLPVRGVTVEDTDGGVTFVYGGHYIMAMKAVPTADIQTMASQLANRGFIVSRTSDKDGAWGFEVYYRGAGEKWAKNTLPASFLVQRLFINAEL